MLDIEQLFIPCRRTKEARAKCCRWWKYRDIWTGMTVADYRHCHNIDDCVRIELQAAHTFPAGMTKYKHIAKYPGACFPMFEFSHFPFDKKFTQEQKLYLLRTASFEDYRETVNAIIDRLEAMI